MHESHPCKFETVNRNKAHFKGLYKFTSSLNIALLYNQQKNKFKLYVPTTRYIKETFIVYENKDFIFP